MKEGTISVAFGRIAFVHKINNLADHSMGFLILRALKGIRKTEGNRSKLKVPAVETAGTFGMSTLKFLKSLGESISSQTCDKFETRWLFEHISLAVTRGNAALVLATGTVHG